MQNIIKILLLIVAIPLLILKIPELHYNYIRSHVGNQVVKITNPEGTHGGTGFNIIAPSGNTYILTNSHVCSHTEKSGFVTVSDASGNKLSRRVLSNSDFTDLCVVEAMPGASGLSLGSEPKTGEIVAVVGHPKLMPLTMTRGEIIAEGDVEILDHLILNENDKCDLPKNKIEDMMTFFGPLKVCAVKIKAYISNATILPGNSGSPVVNFYGNVVAVAFAGDSDSNWGDFVTLPDIIKMLKPF